MKTFNLLAIATLSVVMMACGNGQKQGSLSDVVSEQQLDSAANAASAEALNNPKEVKTGLPQNADAEGLLAKYKLLVDQYVAFADKANQADLNELANKSQELATQINATQRQIMDISESMSDDELTRLSKLSRKFTDAATKVQEALSADAAKVVKAEMQKQ